MTGNEARSDQLLELAWLAENRSMVISDYAAAFCAAFGRTDVTAAHLHGLRKRNGWKVGRGPGRFRGRRRIYSREEIAWLSTHSSLETAEYHRQFCALFGRTDRTVMDLVNLRHREGWLTGRTGRIEAGNVPHNKGKAFPAGRSANSARHHFRKGQLPHNAKGPGHEWTDKKDGYVMLIVAERNPWSGAATRPVLKHKWLWEQLNGPVPAGHVLKCRDGNKVNTDPSNWVAIPRAALPFLNGHRGFDYAAASPELRPAILTLAQLRAAKLNAVARGATS